MFCEVSGVLDASLNGCDTLGKVEKRLENGEDFESVFEFVKEFSEMDYDMGTASILLDFSKVGPEYLEYVYKKNNGVDVSGEILKRVEAKKEENREEKVLEDKDETEFLDENRCIEEEIDKPNISFLEVKEKVKKETDNYLTYKVYIFKDGDSIESILEKYKITKDDLES